MTGAGQGVGRGIALALAHAGAAVVVAARRSATGGPVVDEIEARGGQAVLVETDVTVAGAVQAAVEAAVSTFGALHVVVHNAYAGSTPHRLEDAELALWEANSGTAMWGAYHCAVAAFAHLRAAGTRGRFVLLTSTAGIAGSRDRPLYAAVKAGQRALAKSLAAEWGEHGITVNCVAPLAETPALTEAMVAQPELAERLRQQSALGRVGDAERDVGALVAFLASDAASYITGQTIVCDGGSFRRL